ncbi:hypothetical protein SAMN04487948_10443 [Halogranum amylolyticum]|uniref:DUF7999 domain-containing protein n=1 Tax=Halogranum amylolyticum TaxID=660520 RepID=A0A1H8RIH5_9EURY|nr:hypothetical protein [Halogranum amylolyticum]SEO66210.1 hypothetical protein SAMN04487948_10443 [Halogranum amylolyticum]
MSQAIPAVSRQHAQTVTIEREMNQYGALTVYVDEENATRHVVEYASEELESTLRELPSGSSVPLVTEPIGTRGNAWRATSLTR